MSSLINNIAEQWDLWIGQYRAFFPTHKEDVRDCLKLTQEAGTVDGIVDEKHFDELNYRLAACHDNRSGKVVASLRMLEAAQLRKAPEKETQYQLGHFKERQLAKVAVFTQFAIHPAHEKSQAPMVLLSHCVVEVLKAGGHAVIMSCDPGHYSIYKRLGMRPIGSLDKTAEGLFRIPMIFIPDPDYLTIIHSPVLPLFRGIDFEVYQALVQWYYRLVRENKALQTGSAYYPEDEEDFGGHHSITEGLSEKGREGFLKNALIINCREEEVLITENDGGKSFGYVRKGIVRVVIGGRTMVLLGEGDIFGEIAYILQSKRTAQVIAASPDTEVVLFSETAINSLENEADRTVIWRNLAKVLAQRVVLTNNLLD